MHQNPSGLWELATKSFVENRVGTYLLAFVYGYLGDHDLLRVRTDAEKYLMLAALNLVECVAIAGYMPLSGKT